MAKRRLTNETPYKEKEGKNRRFLAWLFAIVFHMIVVILLAALKISESKDPKKEKEEIAFGMEVVRGRDNTGSNAANVPIEAINPSVTTPSEFSRNITTSDQSDISTNSGKADNKQRKKNTRKKKKANNTTNANNTGGNKEDNTTGQKGDDKNTSGNKGSTSGTLNKNAMYTGKGGAGNDPNLKLSGWKWRKRPQFDDRSNATGKIVLDIRVSDDGKIRYARPIAGTTVGRQIVNQYINKLRDGTIWFALIDPNIEPKGITKGTLTIIINRR